MESTTLKNFFFYFKIWSLKNLKKLLVVVKGIVFAKLVLIIMRKSAFAISIWQSLNFSLKLTILNYCFFVFIFSPFLRLRSRALKARTTQTKKKQESPAKVICKIRYNNNVKINVYENIKICPGLKLLGVKREWNWTFFYTPVRWALSISF